MSVGNKFFHYLSNRCKMLGWFIYFYLKAKN
jgi:hypothetical protein